MRRLILMAALGLAGCSGEEAKCTRISTGEVLHGKAVTDIEGQVHHFEVKDRNGLMGVIDASNSSSFVCAALKEAGRG